MNYRLEVLVSDEKTANLLTGFILSEAVDGMLKQAHPEGKVIATLIVEAGEGISEEAENVEN